MVVVVCVLGLGCVLWILGLCSCIWVDLMSVIGGALHWGAFQALCLASPCVRQRPGLVSQVCWETQLMNVYQAFYLEICLMRDSINSTGLLFHGSNKWQ